MKSHELLELIGEAQDGYVLDAKTCSKRNVPRWAKWTAAAACLCLIAGLVLPNLLQGRPGSAVTPGAGGEGIVPGGAPGDWSGDIDPITASIAVFPDTEKLENVQSATLTDIDEATACAFGDLGAYLPTHVSAGYHFARASVYETTMKDGTKYYQLRVVYADGDIAELDPVTDTATGEQSKEAQTMTSNSYKLWIMNYNPGKEYTVYSGDTLTEYIKNLSDNGVFYFTMDGLFFGFVPYDLSPEDVMAVVSSMDCD